MAILPTRSLPLVLTCAGLAFFSSLVSAQTEFPDPQTDPEAWLEADEPDFAAINTGELTFLESVDPDEQVHQHHNQLTLTPSSLNTGWVQLQQCHHKLDPISTVQIAFREGRVRNLKVTESENIAQAWVDGSTVQMRDVQEQAKLCLTGELKLISQPAPGQYQLRSGPYIRGFLDGYYPMQVTLQILHPDLSLENLTLSPHPQAGLSLNQQADSLEINALFTGRLILELTWTTPPS